MEKQGEWHDILAKREVLEPIEAKTNFSIGKIKQMGNNLDLGYLDTIGKSYQDMNRSQQVIYKALINQKQNVPTRLQKLNRATIPDQSSIIEGNMNDLLTNPGIVNKLSKADGNDFNMRNNSFPGFVQQAQMAAQKVDSRWADMDISEKEEIIQGLVYYEAPFESKGGTGLVELVSGTYDKEKSRFLTDYITANVDYYILINQAASSLSKFDQKKVGSNFE